MTKTKFRCWIPDYHGDEDEGAEIESVMDGYPDYVAKEACEHWHDRGLWSGDPVPDQIEVCVRNTETGALFHATVNAEHALVFSSGGYKKAEG